MITWLFEHRRFRIILVALASLAGQPTRGGAYLPLVGPPPLRFEVAINRAKLVSWATPVLPPPVVAAETNLPSTTDTDSTASANVPPPASAQARRPGSLPPENLSTNSAPQGQSANDLLVITPEMLVDYFKPGNDATNATRVRVLAPVDFTPPASASIPSSQAIYKNQ